MARRCLVLVTTTSYRTDAFVAAARGLGVDVVIGSDRCHKLAEIWPDEAFARVASGGGGGVVGSLPLDFRDPALAASQIASGVPVDAIVATDDHTAVIAALAARALRLPGNSPDASYAARNKARLRERLRAAAVASPRFLTVAWDEPPASVARAVRDGPGFPCVVKPLLLSASRGVIRADDEAGLARALARLGAILRTRPEFVDGIEPAARQVLVEEFVPGVEVALEGILGRGALRPLALYDKPDPLDGPFFEETIYVTPSRLPAAIQRRNVETTAAAAAALGLGEGPIHAELRVADAGPPGPGGQRTAATEASPIVIEVAARSIGGLCARTLRFTLGDGANDHALEELVLRHALGMETAPLERRAEAAAVMMLPIPREGVLRAVDGVDDARRVPGIEDVVVTAKLGQHLVPLPEGGSYLGFVFARAAEPAAAEAAVREAHRRLRFDVAPSL